MAPRASMREINALWGKSIVNKQCCAVFKEKYGQYVVNVNLNMPFKPSDYYFGHIFKSLGDAICSILGQSAPLEWQKKAVRILKFYTDI